MLSDLRDKGPQNSSKDSRVPTEPPTVPHDSSWIETATAGSKQWMSHQERQALVKNRAYAATEPTELSQRPPQ
jgi:hypothetical protein